MFSNITLNMNISLNIWVFFTHSDTVIVGIPNHLVLNLLPAFQGFVHQYLGGVCKG